MSVPSGESYDVAIVGGGMAGAILANDLAASGARVIVLESGPEPGARQEYIDRFYEAAAKTPGSPYPGWPFSTAGGAPRPSVLDVLGPDWKTGADRYLRQVGPSPIVSNYERVPGGTSNHWNGICIRHLPNDFKLRSRYGVQGAVDWPLTYADLEPWYGRAENELGVSGDAGLWNGLFGATRSTGYPMPPIPQSYLDGVFSDRLKATPIAGEIVRVLPTPQARNSIPFDGRPRCMGNTSCVPICPIQAKYDATVHLGKARRQAVPAEIVHSAVAHRVLLDKSGRTVAGIAVRHWWREGDGATAFREGVVTARRYVLAAHTIETAKLLLNSPWAGGRTVANSSDAVGRYLMDKPTQVSWGLAKIPLHSFRGPLSTSIINNFRDGPERSVRGAFVMDVGNDGASWVEGAPYTTVWSLVQRERLSGSELRHRLRYVVSRQMNLTAEIESLPDPHNRVTLSATDRDAIDVPRPEISFRLDEYTMRAFEVARRVHYEIFDAVGSLVPPDRLNQVDRQASTYFEFNGVGYQYRGAGHLYGTTRMGADPKTSVVDPDCRSHDHPNLFVVGSSVFPSTGTANPSLTTVALALRAAYQIRRDLASQGPHV